MRTSSLALILTILSIVSSSAEENISSKRMSNTDLGNVAAGIAYRGNNWRQYSTLVKTTNGSWVWISLRK